MNVLATSDKGMVRDMNQDYYYISNSNIWYNLYILADGMGGYNGGEIASRLAVEATQKYISENIKGIELNRDTLQQLLRKSMEYANEIVYEKSKEDIKLSEMGTTLEVCLIYNNKVYIGHIGDSRVYRIRKNIIRKLTTDHSYVEKLVKDGTITREEAYNHPKKNMLIKALGCEPTIEPDIMVKGFLKDDILLICSDGLTNLLKDKEIYEIITNNLENADKILISRANENGGYDNITSIVIENN
mgnify:CR=1 FL=1